METLNFWCRSLYYFVTWEAGVVEDLLTKTNMVDGITTAFVPMGTDNTADEYDDGSAELLVPELGESKGDRVLRYLRTVVAWHAAMNALCNNEALPKLLRNMEIDLVYIPESPSSALTLREISDEFFIRFPAMMRDHLETLASRYSEKGCHSDNMFIDFVHPEAALMGLLNHYNQYSAQAGHDVGFWGAQRMQQVVQPRRWRTLGRL
ncbi:hypothetical protein SCLCIDRAFT_1031603 [Scleroderma citrinum Foug A]|uniref:Uncharacterized protein n=1 Tax=Scleroderma citrinum Foug A TaxID=1036808 RepID=A0A0C2ZBH6_9AGAM|nr:hypothetical protein SCLCIDRAFT_1031603 [Scleroderma citrinum Foug A]